MSQPSVRSSDWLAGHKAELRRRNAAIRAIDLQKIEFDKQARALDVEWAERVCASPAAA